MTDPSIDPQSYNEAAETSADRLPDLQAQLAQALAERDTLRRLHDDFISALSHDLRTPLNAILNWADILRQLPRDADMTQGLAAIDRSARVQAQMLSDLVDLSRLENGREQLDLETFDLTLTLAQALTASRQMADARSLQLDCEVQPGMRAIQGDPQRLQRVIEHLLANAIRFTPKKGRVTVALRQAEDQVWIDVIDTGYGFGPALMEALEQATGTAQPSAAKLGVGLRLARLVAALHGGSLKASSDGKNQGARFTLGLPRAR